MSGQARFVWRVGDDGPAPEATRPVLPEMCGSTAYTDGGYMVCDLFAGHDGPHIQFWNRSNRVEAAWNDLSKSGPRVQLTATASPQTAARPPTGGKDA